MKKQFITKDLQIKIKEEIEKKLLGKLEDLKNTPFYKWRNHPLYYPSWILFVFILPYYYHNIYKSQYDDLINSIVHYDDIYSSILSKVYGKEVSAHKTSEYDRRYRPTYWNYKPATIPSDATMEISTSLIMNTEELYGLITPVHYWWRRSNGKNSTTFHRYISFLLIPEVRNKNMDFKLYMAKENAGTKIFAKLLKKKSASTVDLENSVFEKKVFLSHNEPVKIRKLLTPSLQEKISQSGLFDGSPLYLNVIPKSTTSEGVIRVSRSKTSFDKTKLSGKNAQELSKNISKDLTSDINKLMPIIELSKILKMI